MKTKILLSLTIIFLAASQISHAQTNTVDSNGLYYASGEKAEIQILQAHIYSVNNANTDFSIRLDTSAAVNSAVLRIDGHEYSCSGWGGSTNDHVMWFAVHGQDEAEATAKRLSVSCDMRSPPGYKLFAQFIPIKTEFNTNEPVTVKFQLNNLDERIVLFQRGGQQRGYRDNQYGFRAQFSDQKIWRQAVSDIGNPINFGGLCGLDNLKPGNDLEDKVDLKKWFAFDKPGTYLIHGFYQLDFYRPDNGNESFTPWNEIWSDYASADFTVVVK
jgi:hypothetical protein